MNIGICDGEDIDGFCDAIAERVKPINITEEILCRYALFCVEKPDDKNDITAFLAWCLERDERLKNET